MNTSLKHLPPFHREKIAWAVRIIIRAVHPEKIILFGLYGGALREGVPADLFPRDSSRALPTVLGAYDLLVVTGRGDGRSDYELQDVIENRCREEVAVTALVHDIGYVNKRIGEGQCFFSMVALEGILLYDALGEALADPCNPDWEQVRCTAERDFARWDQQAKAFFRSAEFNQQAKEWKIAVFLLHQAAEQSYQAILLAFMGYKPTTHNLDKLRRYTNRFSLELALIFPRDSTEEDQLFRLLSAGYVDARYREEFMVTEEEVAVLIARVRRLLEVGERVCFNHFTSLGKRAARR